MQDSSEPRDLRKYARSTQRRLLLGALAVLFGVGGLLIYLIYGPAGAALGTLCLLLALSPVLLIIGALWVLDAIRARSHEP